ncbi:MAG TPA: dicarboxylate/amino acid:cation symporter [Candidatus Methylomirabilis sp.]|nr:dicarboxylate/amino acid:cation symporter [Candidatus Methylomirabilis sp.]
MRKLSLPTWILIATLLGLVAGLLVGKPITNLKFLGDIFLRLVLMAVVPMVFLSVTVALARMELRDLGRVGAKVIAFYIVTTIIAIILGLLAANLVQPGLGIQAPAELKQVAPATKLNIADALLQVIPRNPIDAMAKFDLLGVVVFSIFLGVSLSFLGSRAVSAVDLLETLRDAMIHIVRISMYYAPIGVFALMAWVTGTMGIGILLPLAKYMVTVIVTIIIQTVVVVSLVVWIFAKVDPIQFYRRCTEVMLVAFTTRSSNVSLPVAMECAETKLGVSKKISGFALPLGAVMNQDGMCIYQAVAAILIAQFFGVSFTLGDQIRLLLLILLIGLGSAGIPSGGLVLLAVIVAGMGWPVEGIAIIAGVDAIPDMFRTTLNVLDDLSGAVAVAASEGELDREVYYGKKAVTA